MSSTLSTRADRGWPGRSSIGFDHICVEKAKDPDNHRIAVTVRGTVKMPGNYYRKDDRPELTNPSSYILGTNPAAKRAAVEREVAHLAQARDGVVREARAADDRYANLGKIIEVAQQAAGFEQWAPRASSPAGRPAASVHLAERSLYAAATTLG